MIEACIMPILAENRPNKGKMKENVKVFYKKESKLFDTTGEISIFVAQSLKTHHRRGAQSPT